MDKKKKTRFAPRLRGKNAFVQERCYTHIMQASKIALLDDTVEQIRKGDLSPEIGATAMKWEAPMISRSGTAECVVIRKCGAFKNAE